jgi:regulator of cell morphogenesis and NO signaling
MNIDTAVGDWVRRRPATARVFERLGIDYCCGGKRPLDEACRERQLDAQVVVEQLAATKDTEQDVVNWDDVPLNELCDHIEHTHHAYLKQELPRLAAIIAKVVRAHRETHPELVQVHQAFLDLRFDLEPHMVKEERILFPAIRALERAGAPQSFPFGSVANPIRVMEDEHDHAGACLARIRELTADFRVPDGACNTYRVMLDSLHELEADMHQHVHKENNILFPRAADLEARASIPRPTNRVM